MPSKDIDIILERIKHLENKVDKLDEALNRYKGFLGGMFFVVSCVYAMFTITYNYLGNHN